ncbi:MAG TPA: hypothetical protein VIG99_24810 [Myxococcaceae bacterium]|jgi:hypothetical protein
MFSIDVMAGRLLEMRVYGPTVPADLDAGQARLIHFFQTIPDKLVVCADFTRAALFSQEVATRVLGAFRYDNPRIERSGILISDSAIFGLQLERLITQAGNPNRRCFRDPFELKTFLGKLLVREEHARLARFLSEHPPEV